MIETPVDYFESRWRASDDPWEHARRWSEARKYDVTLAVLPNERYRHALEPACGAGLLTERLARRADRVTASDRFAGAVAATTARCPSETVSVVVADIREGPPGPADLVVISEVLYYFEVAVVRDVLEAWVAACEPGGHVALVHFRPSVPEHVLTGDEVRAVSREVLGAPVAAVDDATFVVDVFDR